MATAVSLELHYIYSIETAAMLLTQSLFIAIDEIQTYRITN